MSEITTAMTEERNRQAYLLHNKIMASGVMVAQSWVQMCKDLKTMRDEKLYTELGYKDFGEYCDEAVGIGARQGYTYIQTYENMGSEVIEKYSSLGITKLSLLAKMNPVDRFDVLDSGEVQEMSTKEVKELVAKSTAQAEQLTLLTEETESLKSENEALKNDNEDFETENSQLEEMVAQLKREVKELKERPTEIFPEPSEEQIEEIRASVTAELKEQFKAEKEAAVKAEKEKTAKKIEKAKADAEKSAFEKKSKEIDEAVKKAKEEAAAENAELRNVIESFKAENAKLENQIKGSDSNIQKVNIYFGAFQENLNKALSAMAEMQGEQKENMTAAIKTALKQILEKIGG
ncbi:MAG: hypothetical protein J6A49_02750 [Clostridia bacterium]|nr:hypothetical protein [Clostridia bacterium]